MAPNPVSPAAPSPSNGIGRNAPQVVAPVAPPAEDALKPRFEELAKQTKRAAEVAKKAAEERKAATQERAAFGKEKAEFEEWKAMRADRKRNPAKYLQSDFGENWYDTLTKYKLEGAPTPDLIASEMDERFSGLRKELDERETKLLKRQDDMRAEELARSKAEYEASAVEHVKQNADKFPLIGLFGEYGSVPNEIEAHFRRTTKQNADGSWEPGEVLTAQQAAEVVEKRIEEIGKKFEEAKAKKQAAKPDGTPAAPTKRNEPPQRRTLSTEVTASTGGEWTPPRDDNERMRRSFAAIDRVMADRNQH